MSEGEYIEITAITKDQSGVYECSANNDISTPDVRTLQVTVNCEYGDCLHRIKLAAQGALGLLYSHTSANANCTFCVFTPLLSRIASLARADQVCRCTAGFC